MRIRLISTVMLILLSVFLVQNLAAAAPLFRWIDKDGHSHVTDYPPPNEEDTETKESTKPEAVTPDKKPAPSSEATPKPKQSKPETPAASATPQPAKSAPPVAAVTPAPKQPPVKSPVPSEAAKPSSATPSPATTATAEPKPASEPPVVKPTPAPAQTPAVVSPKSTPRPLAKPKLPMPSKNKTFPGNLPIGAKAFLWIFVGFVVFVVLGYLVSGYFFYKIAVLLDVQMPWMAWIPFLHLYTTVRAADKPLWWILIIFLVPALDVVPWMDICERLGINKKYAFIRLSFLFVPVLLIAGSILAPLLSPLIVLIIVMVVSLLCLVAVVTQPAICYMAAKRAEQPEPSPLPSKPDYEDDTMPLEQPDYSGIGTAVAGAGIVADKDIEAAKYADDEETVGIQLPEGHDEFTVEENVYENAEVTFDEDRRAADSEAVTIDPDAITLMADTPTPGSPDSEAITIGAEAVVEPHKMSVDDLTVDFARDVDFAKDDEAKEESSEGIEFKLEEFSLDEEPEKQLSPEYGKDAEIDRESKDELSEGIEFKLEDLTLDGQSDLETVSPPQPQPALEDEFKLDLASLTEIASEISLDDGEETTIQPEIEATSDEDAMSDFKFQLEIDDLPQSDSEARELEALKLPEDGEIKLDEEAFRIEPDIGLDSDVAAKLDVKSFDLDMEGIDSTSAEFGAIDEPASEISDAAQSEDEQLQLPSEYSLEIAGDSSEELPEIELTSGGDILPQTDDLQRYSFELDHPMEDEAGNLQVDDSDFKSLSAMVELELAEDKGSTSTQEYDLSLELPPAGISDKALKDIQPEPNPAEDIKPQADIKPKKAGKSPDMAKRQDTPAATPDITPDATEPKSKKGSKSKKEAAVAELPPEVPAESPIEGLKVKLRKSPKPKKESVPEVEIVPLKPKVPDKPHNEWSLEDILVAGLSLEKEQPIDGQTDGHKEETT